MKNSKIFAAPSVKYNPKKIVHSFGSDASFEADTAIAAGYGGIVTNVPFENGFTSNSANHRRFAEIVKILEEKDLSFWIYDENGYPSGKAGGLTLEGHPEFEAKGFFMYKRFAFENTVAKYHLPDEADKIIWAAKYRFGDPATRGTVDYSKMTAVPFESDSLECRLEAGDALYIFAVKTVFEGSHGMHNVSTGLKNINIMDERAVRRFIDVAYEPIARENPEAYESSEAVFTDEPSLFVAYTDGDETWTYACAPYIEGIFERYEEEYGESLLPFLPFIFEGGRQSYPFRIKFYELVGKLVAKAYSAQLRDWCAEHGTVFSGHYLGEDNIAHHVLYYGNFVRVLMNTGYPGLDILDCFPEIFQFLNQKVPQMAARKMGSDGIMAELCPFVMIDEFNKAPYDNMKCITALCYMHGVRKSNSYFQNSDVAEMKDFNDYVGRIGYMLDGLKAESDLFVYYPIEDAQAKVRPRHCSKWVGEDTTTQDALRKVMDALEFGGFDAMLADNGDIVAAASGEGKISGLKIKTVVIPKVDVIRKSTLRALEKLQEMGVRIRFVDGLPSTAAEDGSAIDMGALSAVDIEDVLSELYSDGGIFVSPNEKKIIRAKFRDGEKTIYMLVNMEREKGSILFNSDRDATVLYPGDGSESCLKAGRTLHIPAMRAVFVIF